MEISFDVLLLIVSLAIALFAVYIFLYYRFIYSVIDPLFIWVFTTAFASVLAIEIIPTLHDVIHFFGCQLALWIGFLLAYRRPDYSIKRAEENSYDFDFSDGSVLKWTTYFLLGIFILSNIIIGYSKGFALLSDNPSESKIGNFQEGFGLFRKINWSTGTFVSTSLIYMYLLKKRRIDLVSLLLVILFSSLDGSKSSLLQIAISAGIVFYHPVFSEKQVDLKKFNRYLPLMGLLILSVSFTVLIKENDGIDSAFLAFIKRLLYSADSLIYYYQPINLSYFEKYSAWDYISVVTNPILGFFRLQPYKEAPGVVMVENLQAPGSFYGVTVAPNAPFYIEARIYFNYWFGFPFSLLIGYLYATIRTYYFSLKRSSAFYFIFIGSFCHIASAVIIDVNLAVVQSFDLLFFVVPPYLVITLLVKRRLKISQNLNLFKLLKNI